MLKYFANLPVRKRVGILGIFLGVLAIFAKDPYHNAEAAVNINELAVASTQQVNEISVTDLANWIIQGKTDYRLLDLRSKEKFDEYHIPTSECTPIHSLLKSDLMRNEKIFLYSGDNLSAAQGWFLLRSMDYKSVSILDGGLNDWEKEVLFPSLPANPTSAQKSEFEKMKEVSKFFGGHPQTGTVSANTSKMVMPKLNMPTKIVLKTSKKKKKREGC